MYSLTTKIIAFSNRYKVPLMLVVVFMVAFYIAYLPFDPDQSQKNNPSSQNQTNNATSGWILEFDERADGTEPTADEHLYRLVDTEGNYIKDISATEAGIYKNDPMTFWKLENKATDVESITYETSSDRKFITRTSNDSNGSSIEIAENNGHEPKFQMLAFSKQKRTLTTYVGHLGNGDHLISYDTQDPNCNDSNGQAMCYYYQTFHTGKPGETFKEVRTPKDTSLTSEDLLTVIADKYAIIGGQVEGGAQKLFVFDIQRNDIEEITKETIFLIDDIQSWPYVVDKINGKIYSITKVTSTSYTISCYDIATKKQNILDVAKPVEQINTTEGSTSISMNISPSGSYLYIAYTPAKAQDGTIFNIFSLASQKIVFTSDTDYYDLAQDLGFWDLSPTKTIAFHTTVYDLTNEANPTVSQLSYTDPIQRSYKSFTILDYWKK